MEASDGFYLMDYLRSAGRLGGQLTDRYERAAGLPDECDRGGSGRVSRRVGHPGADTRAGLVRLESAQHWHRGAGRGGAARDHRLGSAAPILAHSLAGLAERVRVCDTRPTLSAIKQSTQ